MQDPSSVRKLGIWSGVGLVVADMVGAGVLTTSGFMALELPPIWILVDWAAGGFVALCGALAYAALARQIPRSGGEYRYLSTMLHPAAGYLAGWTSLLVGFSVPIALAGLGAGAYAQTIVAGVDARIVAAILVVLVTAAHAGDLKTSTWTQNALVVVKAALLLGFVAVGLAVGTNELPLAPQAAPAFPFPFIAFFTSLVYIMFSYTGWNAAIYASEEFERPRRDVPRSMVIGCAAVTLLYLLVNWIFVTNLERSDMVAWIETDRDRITLAHLVMQKLLGSGAATVMSVVVILALVSAMSAMTLIGPRVYAEMARDGYLPRGLTAAQGRPPTRSVLLQGALAGILVFSAGFRELLLNVSSILAIVAALTALSLFNHRRWREDERPGAIALGGAVVFAVASGGIVYAAVQASPSVAVWIAVIVVSALLGYVLTRRARGANRSPRGETPDSDGHAQ